MLRSWLICALLLLPAVVEPAVAEPVSAKPAGDVVGKVREAIHTHEPAAQVATVERSPVGGLYLTSVDGVSGYISADGRYFVVGDMLDLASRSNVTETRRQARRRGLLQKVAPDDAIVFGPAKPRHTIIVFTDVDCPHCRKLHGELDRLHAEGIAVRYMAFPRSGAEHKGVAHDGGGLVFEGSSRCADARDAWRDSECGEP